MKYNQLTTLEFIQKAIKKHGYKYLYHLVNYINNYTKITIVCPEHGDFEQTPGNHLSGKGCPCCAKKLLILNHPNRLTVEEFIQKSLQIHGNKYDYSKVVYIARNIKVIIICSIHGQFQQTPSDHLSGCGCPKCWKEKISETFKYTQKEYIKKCIEIHGNKYDYSLVIYINSQTKITIICPEHGEFKQRANAHLNGQGCPDCYLKYFGISLRSNLEEFIPKAHKKHNNFYDYSKSIYIKSSIKITIICPMHGEFEQTPNNHLRGAGCPCCKESKGEKLISQILDKNHIQYLREYKIPGAEYRFEYDFYLPEHNLFIEFHGIQHYKAIEYFGGEEGFKYIRRNDMFKKELAKLAKIKLIEFNYKQLKYLTEKEFEKLIMNKIKKI